MSIKEQIAALPGEQQPVSMKVLKQYIGQIPPEEEIYRTNDPSLYPLCSTSDLKALAASHTALLAAAKNGYHAACDATALAGADEYTDELDRINPILDRLEAAIAEAEKI